MSKVAIFEGLKRRRGSKRRVKMSYRAAQKFCKGRTKGKFKKCVRIHARKAKK